MEEAVLSAESKGWIIWTDECATSGLTSRIKPGGGGEVNEREKWRCVWSEAEYKILRGR